MKTWPIRLKPGADLRQELEALQLAHGWPAAFVVAGVGSLSTASLRFASASRPSRIDADLELLCLSGTLGTDGAHLHASVSDPAGRVTGGHVARGCIVRTTAEILVAVLPEWHFSRERDAATGYPELVICKSATPSRPAIARDSISFVPPGGGAPDREKPHD